MTQSLTRRELVQTLAGAALTLPLVRIPLAQPPLYQTRFFSPAEFALVDELSDMIIPTDEKSGGARAAGVAAYLDARMAESFEKEPPQRWRAGLKAVDALAREMSGKAFMDSSPEQRLAVLTRMAAGESDAKTPAEQFFKEIKGATIGTYYTSKIGIHDDQGYKGNVYQTGEYAGLDAS
jgi:hypothetical protein